MARGICLSVATQLLTGIFLAFYLTGILIASEVILTAENLNTSLKEMQRNNILFEKSALGDQPEHLFRLGVAASEMAMLLTKEVSVYGMQQKGLIDLALERTREFGVEIVWFPEKGRFIYNGAAYRQYLQFAPDGAHAAESTFRLLEIEFFQSVGDDVVSLLASTERKLAYLAQFPDYEQTPEIGLLLALDYRDLWRLYQQKDEVDTARKFSENTLDQYRWVIDHYPGTRHARVATGLLDRFESELYEAGSVLPDNLSGE
jgi:hypothetical protein